MEQEQRQGELAAENHQLARIMEILHRQWRLAKEKNREREEQISLAHEDMREYAPYTTPDGAFTGGFNDFLELSEYARIVMEEREAHQNTFETIQSLERMMDTPYFARIDLRFEGETEAEKLYIGRHTLMDPATKELHIYDWRAPVASVFYRFGPGKASYEAPAGTVTADVLLKRQYEIRGGKLKYFFDADVQIVDEFLRSLLSRNASPTMRAIVETIQKDQDIIIRDMQSDVLMVQGAAGSGKTSVALHRAAYLMYQGLAGRLSANDILILSPNRVFEEYIAQVLPDLGESSVKSALLEDIFRRLLPGVRIEARERYLERLLSLRDEKQAELLKSSEAFKGSQAFMRVLDRLVQDLPRNWIPFQDIDYDGQCVAQREGLKSAMCNPKKLALPGVRLGWLEREVLERIHALRRHRMRRLEEFAARYPQHATEAAEFARWISIEESTRLIRRIRTFTRVDCPSLYRRLFSDPDRFYRLARGIALPENIEEIRRHTTSRLQEEALTFEDAAAVSYLYMKIYGYREYRDIRQLVVDEAQDGQPLHFALLKELFPKARFTILGDVGQSIGKQADLTLYEQIGRILDKEKTVLVTLDKSFRCTMEIWRFAARFLNPGAAGQCFSRSGDEPAIFKASGLPGLMDLMVREMDACREKGLQSICLICKTEADAAIWYERLKDRAPLKLIKTGGAAAPRGTFLLPIYLAKGLEFDAVLVCDADRAHYCAPEDRQLLYIAATRALHRLNLFYTGEISPFLEEDAEGEGSGWSSAE